MYTYSVSGYDVNNKKFSPCSLRFIRKVGLISFMVARWLYPDFKIVCVWPFGLLDYGSATLRCKI